MAHTILGFVAALVTLTVLLRTWDTPRWEIRAFCVCALLGAVVFALSRPGPVEPAADGPTPSRYMVPGPVVEGTWDTREPRRIGIVR